MLERRTRLGKYEVMDELGVGAMATVYKAKNTEDGSPVAIKIPDRRLLTNVRALQQFKREGQALIRLHHPNIVRVHSVGQQNDLPYIVMDYVEGHALAQEMQSRGRFSPEEAIEFLLPMADALDYSHTEKTFHCDVKPGNIRLTVGECPCWWILALLRPSMALSGTKENQSVQCGICPPSKPGANEPATVVINTRWPLLLTKC